LDAPLQAEGAGQDLFKKRVHAVDASGNVHPEDIGPFLSDAITAHFKKIGNPVTLKFVALPKQIHF
jgi:hypothetical protein